MIPDSHKTSLLIPSQLPEFIRDDPDYSNFVLFLQAYYQWLEENNNVTDRVKNILNYIDIDDTSDEFLQYFYNEFLNYFPSETLANKNEVLKIAKQLYQNKGTQASYQFLFRVLYNTDVDFYYTKDSVLKASAGIWYVPRSLRLLTQDTNFLNLNNPKYGSLKVFGETTKSLATIENVVISGNKTEIFISDIERLFQSGEFVHIIDANNQTVLFNTQPLRAKIVGQISQIIINPNYRGSLYQPNDPVAIYGGLSSPTAHAASATVGTVTSGSVQKLTLQADGYGYTLFNTSTTPGLTSTNIEFSNLGQGAVSPTATVGTLNYDPAVTSLVNFLPIDNIGLKANTYLGDHTAPVLYNFLANASANINTKLSDAFTFTSFESYPISSVLLNTVGSGISATPIITAKSLYNVEHNNNVSQADLKGYGVLAPIQIVSSGTGYASNDTINIVGGSGYGAAANVLSVDANGSILTVGYVNHNSANSIYPIGGMAYRPDALPTITINSANGANAILQVTGILGDGAVITPTVSRIGTIQTISISDYGEDYIGAPNVSLRVQDLLVTGLTLTDLPSIQDIVYQGPSPLEATYIATVDSVSIIVPDSNPRNSVYSLRVFDYNSKPNYNQSLKIYSKDIVMTLNNTVSLSQLQKVSYYSQVQLSSSKYDSANGVITYGDGTAKANATFLNGLVIGNGQYLNTSGQPSSFDVLQSQDYNNYTYELRTDKEFSKYKDVLLNLLNPSGMQAKGIFSNTTNQNYNYSISDISYIGRNLSYFTGNTQSYAVMIPPHTDVFIDSGSVTQVATKQSDFGYETDPVTSQLDYQKGDEWFYITDFNDGGANTVYFGNMNGANIATFITSDSTIQLTTINGDIVYSAVNSINYVDNFITLQDSFYLTYQNVATVSGNANSSLINIQSLTGNYDNYNHGIYTNPNFHLVDVLRIGDVISIQNNNPIVVNYVDYTLNIAFLESNLSNTVTNVALTVGRSYITSNVQIFTPYGN